MSRARNIKPGFFKNDLLAECSPLARLLFAGLWCEADREGRLEDRPKRIKAECLPYDETECDDLLNELAAHGFITRYVVEGTGYIAINEFAKHQNPHQRELPSVIPAPSEAKHNLGSAEAQPRIELAEDCTGSARLFALSPIPYPDSSEKILSSADDELPAEPRPTAQAIPYDDILAAFHEALPMLPGVRLLNDGRKKKIKSRWHELAERQTLDYWRSFFAYAAKSDFLTGRNGKWTACNFDWLLEPNNHLKVAEGNYENGSRT